MELVQNARAAVAEFCGKHNLGPIAISEPWLIQEAWPLTGPPAGDWPNARAQGVYLIFGSDRLLYVGKSNGTFNRIGYRLGNRFRPNPTGQGRLSNDNWSTAPLLIMTIGIDDAQAYMVPSFEQFLIWKLDPKDNKLRPYDRASG